MKEISISQISTFCAYDRKKNNTETENEATNVLATCLSNEIMS